jgi:Pyruvate/2-oxoacid:ferredoxin oxidoreductase delta subunit
MMEAHQTSFHMWQMVRVEVEISESVHGFPVDLCGQCRLFCDDQNIQKGNQLSRCISVVNCMEGLKLLGWLRKFCNHFGP